MLMNRYEVFRYRSIAHNLDIAVPTTDSSMPNIGLALFVSSIAKRCLAILKYRLIDTIPKVAFTNAKTTLVAMFVSLEALLTSGLMYHGFSSY